MRFVSETGETEAVLVSVRSLAASQSFEQDQSVLLENDTWLEDWQDMAQRITAD